MFSDVGTCSYYVIFANRELFLFHQMLGTRCPSWVPFLFPALPGSGESISRGQREGVLACERCSIS